MQTQQQEDGKGILIFFILTVLTVGFILTLFTGCKSSPPPTYTQGVNVMLGMKLPGVDSTQITVFDYISGIRISSTSNMPFSVTYKEAVTNSYFGVIKITESRETTVDTKEQR